MSFNITLNVKQSIAITATYPITSWLRLVHSLKGGMIELRDFFSDHLEDIILSSGHLASINRESPVKHSLDSVKYYSSHEEQL